MIRYALKCTNGHGFESWFASAGAFDKLAGAGMVACPDCGSTEITKSLMAPSVRPARKSAAAPAETSVPETVAASEPAAAEAKAHPLSTPSHPMEAALKALRAHVEKNSEYVGARFSREVRAIHGGEAPDRMIHGEARIDELREMLDEGMPVAPLPFGPARKTN